MRMKKAVAMLAAGVFCVSALAACGSNDSSDASSSGSSGSSGSSTTTASSGSGIDKSKPPVRLALDSIKLPGVNLFDGHVAGAQAAAKAINAKGGFGGREVIVDTCNSQLQPALATSCAHKLIANKPIAEFGCEVAWGTTGLPLFAKANVPSFNCLNTEQDFSNSMSFGVAPGAYGYQRSLAKYACDTASIKKVVVFDQDLPQQRRDAPAAVGPILKGCNKQVTYVWYAPTGQDLTPYVNQATQAKPDFVIALTAGAATVPMYKGFAAAGIPASKVGIADSSVDYDTVLKPAGAAANGAIIMGQTMLWGEKGNPQVEAYLKDMSATGHGGDAKSSNPMFTYGLVNYFYKVAEKIGFDKFDSASLTQFMKDGNNGFPIPLSRSLVFPAPKGFPAQRQPYSRVLTWDSSAETMTPVTQGTDDGWVDGYF